MKTGLTRKRRILRRLRWWLAGLFGLYLLPPGYQLATHYAERDGIGPWWSLSRESSAQAPRPSATRDAIIQVYAARAVRWRGALGVHTWFATRRSDESFYQRIEVMGFGLRWSRQSVYIRQGIPDRYWYGNRPALLREIRGGAEVDRLIDRIHEAARQYPYAGEYRIWPGPNSNTFTAYLGRQVPQLSLDLPPNAIGKDYPVNGGFLRTPPGGKGLQFSFGGLFGFLLGPEEGVEINLLGLTAGIDFSPFALKLPAVGRVGYADSERRRLP